MILEWIYFVLIAGVAYSKHIVHLYTYHGGDELRNHLEVCVTVTLFFFFFGLKPIFLSSLFMNSMNVILFLTY